MNTQIMVMTLLLGASLHASAQPSTHSSAPQWSGIYEQPMEFTDGLEQTEENCKTDYPGANWDGTCTAQNTNTVTITQLTDIANSYDVSIETVGPDMTQCSFEGTLKVKGTTLTGHADGCRITLRKGRSGKLQVHASESQACYDFCGAHADLSGTGDGFSYTKPTTPISSKDEN